MGVLGPSYAKDYFQAQSDYMKQCLETQMANYTNPINNAVNVSGGTTTIYPQWISPSQTGALGGVYAPGNLGGPSIFPTVVQGIQFGYGPHHLQEVYDPSTQRMLRVEYNPQIDRWVVVGDAKEMALSGKLTLPKPDWSDEEIERAQELIDA